MSDRTNPGGAPLPPPSLPNTGVQPSQLGDAAGQAAGHAAGAPVDPTTLQRTADSIASAARHPDQQIGSAGSDMGQAAADGGQRSADAIQSGGGGHGAADAARTQGPNSTSGRRLNRLRHLRPRASLGFVGGAAASVAVAAAGIAFAARDDDSPQRAAASTTIETVVEAPVASSAPVTAAPTTAAPTTAASGTAAPDVTDAPITVAEPTTTIEPTTTVPALPSGAGTYAVIGGEIIVVGSLVNGSIGAPPPTTWVLAGPCDGVAECTITVEGTSVASTAGVTPLSAGGTIELAPVGPGTYLVTSASPLTECGDGVGTMTITLSDGTLSGEWVVSFAGGDACGFTSLSITYTGTRS